MFKDWLIGNMGVPGEYKFTTMYWIVLACVLLSLVIAGLLAGFKKISPEVKRHIVRGICWFQLGFEVTWRLIYIFIKKDTVISCWPMYPCNLGGILIPIIGLTNWKLGKRMFYLFGFVGACLTFAVPDGIFSTSIFVFPILKSVLQHTGLLLIPLFEYVSGTFRPSVKDYPFLALGTCVHIINCEVIDRLFGFEGDYMFLRSDMPFTIPGVPQFIIVIVFGAIVFYILSFLLNINESIDYYKKLFKKGATK